MLRDPHLVTIEEASFPFKAQVVPWSSGTWLDLKELPSGPKRPCRSQVNAPHLRLSRPIAILRRSVWLLQRSSKGRLVSGTSSTETDWPEAPRKRLNRYNLTTKVPKDIDKHILIILNRWFFDALLGTPGQSRTIQRPLVPELCSKGGFLRRRHLFGQTEARSWSHPHPHPPSSQYRRPRAVEGKGSSRTHARNRLSPGPTSTQCYSKPLCKATDKGYVRYIYIRICKNIHLVDPSRALGGLLRPGGAQPSARRDGELSEAAGRMHPGVGQDEHLPRLGDTLYRPRRCPHLLQKGTSVGILEGLHVRDIRQLGRASPVLANKSRTLKIHKCTHHVHPTATQRP